MTSRIRAAFFVLLTALVVLGGARAGLVMPAAAQETTPTPVPVVTGNIPMLALSPELCFLLVAARGKTVEATSCENFGSPSALQTIADITGDGDGIVEPEDFKGIDLDGNQLHQMDDFPRANGSLSIMAFVSDDDAVDFETTRGVLTPPGTAAPGVPNPGADPVDDAWHCDTQAEDEDCDGDGVKGDGVVVARLRARYGDTIASTGPGTVKIFQGTDRATISVKVVGEPRTLSFITLESAIQVGVKDLDGDGKLGAPGECPLPGDSAGFLGANGTAERSIVLAVAKDNEGNAVTGAIILWETDDVDKGVMASALTPTLDLGSFGFGAPNILCGIKEPGTVKVTAQTSKDVILGSTVVGDADPAVYPDKKSVEFKVIGLPATVTLVAAPSQLACDGKASSKVSATVLDASGGPVAAGYPVRFDVKVLGTASPIIAKTNDKGMASSTITPLASGAAGVPVAVTAGEVQASILISCGGAAAPAPGTQPPPPPPPSGQTGGAGGPATSDVLGGTRMPRSGEGALQWSSTLPVWAYLLAAAGLMMLFSAAMRSKRR